ncbi:MAG: molybdopterin molybdotransferase MoeA [Gemmatimonadaceae bacterium]|nr:molybdopterin molybdotransferase MoeA [Gemmatimonadaceae bacterium]
MTVTRLGVADASRHMLAGVEPLPGEEVTLERALGRVLARDVVSTITLPPWNNASMDGFALRGADVAGASAERPVRLRVVETIAAGRRGTRDVGPGEATRIMTGAPVPPGADSVVRVEDTDGGADPGTVMVRDDRDAGRNVRARGEDIRADSVVLTAGTAIAAAHVGVLSSVGCAAPFVHRRPRVAVLATGDELVPLERFAEVQAGERIVSSNSYSLAAAVEAAGGEPVPLGIAPDDPGALAHCLRRADGCDMVLTSGGVSVGDFDYTRAVVGTLGGELSLWRVRMRPGAPLGFGRLFSVPWLGLPGNPVSALVTFELFARPLLRVLAGHRCPHRPTVQVVLGQNVELAAPLTHYLRAVFAVEEDGRLVATLTGAQSSGMLTSMALADGLLVLPGDRASYAAGTLASAVMLDGDLKGSVRFPG